MSTYEDWCEKVRECEDIREELKAMSGDAAAIESSFYRELEFGTGGLRGVLGAGTNRMNVYTVARASKGLADYIIKKFPADRRSIAVSYDSRIKSDLFATVAANIFADSNIKVYICRQLMPTPFLSFCVRELKCAAGIMITASHNPSQYNGYKVYGPDGCQITTEAASEILHEIQNADYFSCEIDEELKKTRIEYVSDSVYDDFIACVKAQSVLGKNDRIDRSVNIVYSPLNGTGLLPVTRVLAETGFTNVKTVPEQQYPDGRFPTCASPNPELPEAMELGIALAKITNAGIFIATDPDCDRIGVAVADGDEFRILSGNEVGVLLLDFICAQRTKNGTMPEEPVVVKTIVTTDMAEQIAQKHGVKTVNVLTGFKFIGEQIGALEDKNQAGRYVFGFEESCGYLSGSYVRDKDAVDGALLVCEMFAYYKSHGKSLTERLHELYNEYGFRRNALFSYMFEGPRGFAKMQEIMQGLRSGVESIGGYAVVSVLDYSVGIGSLPRSDVLKFILEGNSTVTVRPSGTEPKLKIYTSVSAENSVLAKQVESDIITDLSLKMS